jgi:hypothetical protein
VQVQRRALDKELPATLEAPTRYQGEVRTAKVRVYADADYRAQNVQWQKGFEDWIDYANQLLQPMLGVRLEAEYKAWDRRATDATLRDDLGALAELDPGDDVAWVIGLTSALPLVSASMDELGISEELGTHIMLRGYADVEERKAFARAFPDLDASERDEVLDARRRHKQTVLFVHEVGHTLGAIHETDEAWIMAPIYKPVQASISDRNRDLMLLALEDRLKPKDQRDAMATAQKLLSAIESADWGGWVGPDKEAEVQQLHAEIETMKKGETASPVPPAAYNQYAHAEELAQAGQYDDGLAELEPIIAAYPGNAAIRLLVCQIRLAKSGPKDKDALDACTKAADLAPGDPTPFTLIAQALLKGGDRAGARAQLAEAESRIPNLKAGAPQAWVQVATMYQAMGALTWAEDAIAKSGLAEHPIALWASQIRARYGVPRDGKRWKITPENESELVVAVRGVLDLVYAGKLPEAEKGARAAEKRWPGAPGLLAARCDLEMRKKNLAGAKKLCKQSIAGYEGDSWAHYLLGILILQGKDTDAGIESLRAATDADPELAQAWRALAKAYQRKNDKTGLDDLRQTYQQRFGQPLPE